jgi:hypothetical protein
MMRLETRQLIKSTKQGALLILSACAAMVWPLTIQAAEDVKRLVEQVIRRLNLQTSLPNEPDPTRTPWPNLPEVMLWLIIIAALALAVYAFRDLIPFLKKKQRQGWSDGETFSGDSKLAASESKLRAADELAASGNFVEAMHTLLLQGLAIMRERLNDPISDALTSREILRSAKLPQDGRNSLGDIVDRVEWTYFGARPATRIDYDACRASFTNLTDSLHRASAA